MPVQAIREALGKMRLRLLDLTSRNRLLNFKHSPGKSLQFVGSSLDGVFCRLSGNQGAVVEVKPVPEPLRNLWIRTDDGRLVRPEVKEHAKHIGIDTSYDISGRGGEGDAVCALYYPDDLARHCRKLAREAKSAIEETGANVLFLVAGFLEFPDSDESQKTLFAPLIAMPVSLEKTRVDRTSGQESYGLRYTGEDLAENLSLREKLSQQYGFQLPEFGDEAGPEPYLEQLEQLIMNKAGWRVKRQMTLALLSFSKMLMVIDIDPDKWPQGADGTSALVAHETVQMVFRGAPGGDGDGEHAAEYAIDGHDLQNIPLIFDADTSQHSALIDALGGRNLVIEGPPGTGKSQTITNLIAVCLSQGKRVLFVSEKLAALQVVKKRLVRAHLEHFCLELHSNKTQKKHVLDELDMRMAADFPMPNDLATKLKVLEEKRQHLQAYADILNGKHGNACDLTVHQILWRAERYRLECKDDFSRLQTVYVPNASALDAARFESLSNTLARTVQQYLQIGAYGPSHPYWGLFVEALLPDTELAIERALGHYLLRFEAMQEVFCEGARLLTLPEFYLAEIPGKTLCGAIKSLVPAPVDDMAHEMLPRLFSNEDSQGVAARATLEHFRDQLDFVARLRQTVGNRLLPTASVDDEVAAVAKRVAQSLEELGVGTQSSLTLRATGTAIAKAAHQGMVGLTGLQATAAMAGLAFNGDPESVVQLITVVNVAAAAPRELLPFRHPTLRHAATEKTILCAQEEFNALHKEEATLEQMLYLDSVPAESALKEAIATLREGDAWYRIFQGRWRSACQLHRTLDRSKAKKTGTVRLTEIERLYKHQRASKAWRENGAYRDAMGPFFDEQPPQFDSALRLTRWHTESHRALVDAGITTRGLLVRDEDSMAKFAALHTPTQAAAAALEHFVAVARAGLGNTPIVTTALQAPHWADRLRFGKLVEQRLNDATACLDLLGPSQLPAIEVLGAVSASVALPNAVVAVETAIQARELLGDRYSGPETNLKPALAALTYGRQVLTAGLSGPMTRLLLSENVSDNYQELSRLVADVGKGWQAVAEFVATMKQCGAFNVEQWATVKRDDAAFVGKLVTRTANALSQQEQLLPWVQYVQSAARARSHGLGDFVDAMESERVVPDHVVAGFGYCFYASIAKALFVSHSELSQFAAHTHEQIRSEYGRLDREITALRGRECANKAASYCQPPAGLQGVRVGDKTQMELIRHMVAHPGTRVTLRRMMRSAGQAVLALKPCFMMGPQAVAQYLPAGEVKFDVVVMDEASQLRPEEAIGAIARGAQLIVVGDPKQLPPTTFFDRLGTSDDAEEGQQMAVVDSESILDVCMGHFRPVRTLRWHYRSEHHSLIAFSNHRFYNDRLIVFPSPYEKSKRLGVRYHYIKGAQYQGQTNRIEAARVVDAAIAHMVTHPEDSLGIVTLNLRQRDLLEEMLDQRCRNFPATEDFRQRWGEEGMGLFVKNLESVQGDERHTIFISTTFGPPNEHTTEVRQAFGPISRQTGWRRLNVLFTRARRSVHVFSSMLPENIVVDNTTPLGTRVLREYLEYARSGVLSEVAPTGGEAESDFEVAVTEVLQDAGYDVVPQLGVAGYRIDIAVRHPRYRGAYIAAIECDGAAYHSGVSVRDRDRIRQEILESLGWQGRIWRVWSADWFRNPRHETSRMLDFLKARAEEPFEMAYVEDATQEPLQQDVRFEIQETATSPDQYTLEPDGLDNIPLSQASRELAETTVLIEDIDEDLEVKVGDTVTYVDLARPATDITLRIVDGPSDLVNDVVSEATPLAQTLLGACVGDDVVLRQEGRPAKSLRIKKLNRSSAVA